MTPKEEILTLANYLAGYADAQQNEKMSRAAEWLNNLSNHICVGGFIGCRGGEKCTSDHK